MRSVSRGRRSSRSFAARRAADGQPSFLVGDRLVLRPVSVRDVTPEYVRWMNDQEVVEFLETGFFPVTMAALRRYVASKADRSDVLFLAMVDRRTGRHVGNIKLEPIKWRYGTAEVGLLIGDKRYWGRGYGREALRLVLAHAFGKLNLRKVTAGVLAPNRPSLRMFLGLGFVVEGRQRAQAIVGGKPCDLILLGKFRKGSR